MRTPEHLGKVGAAARNISASGGAEVGTGPVAPSVSMTRPGDAAGRPESLPFHSRRQDILARQVLVVPQPRPRPRGVNATRGPPLPPPRSTQPSAAVRLFWGKSFPPPSNPADQRPLILSGTTGSYRPPSEGRSWRVGRRDSRRWARTALPSAERPRPWRRRAEAVRPRKPARTAAPRPTGQTLNPRLNRS